MQKKKKKKKTYWVWGQTCFTPKWIFATKQFHLSIFSDPEFWHIPSFWMILKAGLLVEVTLVSMQLSSDGVLMLYTNWRQQKTCEREHNELRTCSKSQWSMGLLVPSLLQKCVSNCWYSKLVAGSIAYGWDAKHVSEERLASGLQQLDCLCEWLPSVYLLTLLLCFGDLQCQFPELEPPTWIPENRRTGGSKQNHTLHHTARHFCRDSPCEPRSTVRWLSTLGRSLEPLAMVKVVGQTICFAPLISNNFVNQMASAFKSGWNVEDITTSTQQPAMLASPFQFSAWNKNIRKQVCCPPPERTGVATQRAFDAWLGPGSALRLPSSLPSIATLQFWTEIDWWTTAQTCAHSDT